MTEPGFIVEGPLRVVADVHGAKIFKRLNAFNRSDAATQGTAEYN
jgi:hypothetical protein